MDYGFVKVAAGTAQIKVADCRYNAQKIIECIQLAKQKGVQLLVLNEMCVTGYTCSDLFLQPVLIQQAQQAVVQIAQATQGSDMVVVVGAPLQKEYKLYNCAIIIQNGDILGAVPKVNLPNYGEFYEARQFTPAPSENSVVTINAKQIPFGKNMLFACKERREFVFGVEICEDLWAPTSPSNRLCAAGATVIVNPSASDEIIGKDGYRRHLVSMQSAKHICAYAYADAGQGESTTDMVFAGHNLICENGTVMAEDELFSDQMVVADVDVKKLVHERLRTNTYPFSSEDIQLIEFSQPNQPVLQDRQIDPSPFVPKGEKYRMQRCRAVLELQAQGLKKRIEHTGCRSLVVGLSGGLDSTLALLVMCHAMDLCHRDRKEIYAVTMPCFGTTSRTRSNAQKMAKCLGVSFQQVDISHAVQVHLQDIGHDLNDYSVTYENAQARERTQVLMDIANKTGGLVVGTGDLSELALGWATYNGDHMSMYAVNASVPKTLIRYLVMAEADRADQNLKEVLYDILDTPVSPELLPAKDGEIAQITEDLVGPYQLHDFFLYNMLRCGYEPLKIYKLAQLAFKGVYSDDPILHWLQIFIRRFFAQQFKRSCLPDGPKVGSVTLSPRGDWRMPSDACATVWLEQLQQIKEK